MAPRDTRTWMWLEAFEQIERAERLHRQFFRLAPGQRQVPTWEPPVDVYETSDAITILVALPGVEPSRIQVAVEDATLIVNGLRPLPASGQTAVIHRLEIPHGRFERRIELSAGRYELRQRDTVNGCLVLTLGKL
ncbi:MAG: Hsp20/alpha crystallin family protein [Rhodospirillales bacterium]|nr:MAG: Hsp20/alpha crystallin family protein [Rhodospirillales bacterium]